MKYRWNENADNRECTGEKEQWAISKGGRATKFTRAATLPRRISPLSSRGLNVERFWIAINSNSPRMAIHASDGSLHGSSFEKRRQGVAINALEHAFENYGARYPWNLASNRTARRSRDGALPLECPTTSHALITFTFKLAVFARVPGTYYLFTTAHFSVIRLRPRVLEESHVWWGKNTNGTKNYEGRFFFCRICIIISTNSFLFFLDCNEL